MADPPFRLALAHYDRHMPFFEGAVGVAGADLIALDVGENAPGRHGRHRHRRMLNENEFDAAEVSLSSFLMAKDRGAALTAIPVFPRRLFSLSQIWCRSADPVLEPADLAGRRVGLNRFQTTLSVLAKADLQTLYGVPWREIRWVTAAEEIVPFDPAPGTMLERVPPGRHLAELLLSGEIDALIVPYPPAALVEAGDRVRRVFANPRAEELKYYRSRGYYPIMHLVAFQNRVLEARPGLAASTLAAFSQASALCRSRWLDPNWSSLAWGRLAFDEQDRDLGPHAWDNGLRRNRENLEWFASQSLDQGLIRRLPTVEKLFHASTLDT